MSIATESFYPSKVLSSNALIYKKKIQEPRDSLAVQLLGLCASTSRGMGLNPGQGIKIRHASGWSQKKIKTMGTYTIYIL